MNSAVKTIKFNNVLRLVHTQMNFFQLQLCAQAVDSILVNKPKPLQSENSDGSASVKTA